MDGRLRLAILAAIAILGVAGCAAGLPEFPSPTPRATEPASPSPRPSPSPEPSPTPTPSPSPSPAPTPTVHVVVAGDTLSSIAKKYKTTILSIAYWNRTEYPTLDPDGDKYKPDRIERKWRLRLYPGKKYEPDETGELAGPAMPPLVTPSPSPPPSASPGGSPGSSPPPSG